MTIDLRDFEHPICESFDDFGLRSTILLDMFYCFAERTTTRDIDLLDINQFNISVL